VLWVRYIEVSTYIYVKYKSTLIHIHNIHSSMYLLCCTPWLVYPSLNISRCLGWGHHVISWHSIQLLLCHVIPTSDWIPILIINTQHASLPTYTSLVLIDKFPSPDCIKCLTTQCKAEAYQQQQAHHIGQTTLAPINTRIPHRQNKCSFQNKHSYQQE
jgi:hypothetical protein